MANYALTGVYTFGQPKYGDAKAVYSPPSDPSSYNRNALKKPKDGIKTPFGKHQYGGSQYGGQSTVDGGDMYGWKSATASMPKAKEQQYNKTSLKMQGRLDIKVPPPKPISTKDKLEKFSASTDSEDPTEKKGLDITTMSPVDIMKMLIEGEEEGTAQHAEYVKLYKYFVNM